MIENFINFRALFVTISILIMFEYIQREPNRFVIQYK